MYVIIYILYNFFIFNWRPFLFSLSSKWYVIHFIFFGYCTSLYQEFLGKGFRTMPQHALQRRACFTKEGISMAKRANPYLTVMFQPLAPGVWGKGIFGSCREQYQIMLCKGRAKHEYLYLPAIFQPFIIHVILKKIINDSNK